MKFFRKVLQFSENKITSYKLGSLKKNVFAYTFSLIVQSYTSESSTIVRGRIATALVATAMSMSMLWPGRWKEKGSRGGGGGEKEMKKTKYSRFQNELFF